MDSLTWAYSSSHLSSSYVLKSTWVFRLNKYSGSASESDVWEEGESVFILFSVAWKHFQSKKQLKLKGLDMNNLMGHENSQENLIYWSVSTDTVFCCCFVLLDTKVTTQMNKVSLKKYHVFTFFFWSGVVWKIRKNTWTLLISCYLCLAGLYISFVWVLTTWIANQELFQKEKVNRPANSQIRSRNY